MWVWAGEGLGRVDRGHGFELALLRLDVALEAKGEEGRIPKLSE